MTGPDEGTSGRSRPEHASNEAAARRADLLALLGELPSSAGEVACDVVRIEERDGLRIESLLLELNGFEPVPATFLKPAAAEGRSPVVLYSHAHGGNFVLGKDELLLGRPSLQDPPYGLALADLGYSVLCFDAWGFGERRGRDHEELFKGMLWQGQVLWGMMVHDSLRALDYLVTREDVDGERIAALGMSMGSTMSWWLAALDERVKICVDLCCLTDFDALVEERGLNGHGIYYYVPGLLKRFGTADINALIAPRPHLSLAGRFDRLTPVRGLERVDAALKHVYQQAGAPDAWRLEIHDVGHFETGAMRRSVLAFLTERASSRDQVSARGRVPSNA